MLEATRPMADQLDEPPGQDDYAFDARVASAERTVQEAVLGSRDHAHAPRHNPDRPEQLTSGEQVDGSQIIELPPPRADTATASLHALQEWEGHVSDVRETDFVALLIDLSADRSHEDEEAVIPRMELSDADDAKLRAGRIFRWVIGYERSPSGTRKRVSQIVFRDLPTITKRDIKEGAAWAREMAEFLNP